MWDDYAALKAETVRQIETALPSLEAYIGKLEAEVERLTKERDHYQWASTNDGIACNERARENQDLENQIDALKAENERLRKAGDEMEKWIKGFNQPHISAFEWHIAKVVQS
jgi:prefoldin subunit 5